MANRQRGTTRKRADRRATIAQPESATATGGELLARMDRKVCERLVLDALNALRTRTSRTDGKRCIAFAELDLATQYEAGCLYLIDLRSAAEIRELLGVRITVQTRVFERWCAILKAEYIARLNARLAEAETSADLAVMRGDLPALSVALWSELITKAMGYLRSADYAELDNNTRHLLQRLAEGSSDMAKVQTEVEKTRAQTEKLRRQLRDDLERAHKKGHGRVTLGEVAKIIDNALGLPGREAAA